MRRLMAVVAMVLTLAARAYDVKCPADMKPWEMTAISELRTYLAQLATNGSVRVAGGEATFYVGDTKFARERGLEAASFRDEEWLVRNFGSDVVLVGGGTRGTLYAVYHFLEDECGVRWWMDDDEDVPVAGALEFEKLDRRGKPYIRCRDVYRTGKCDRRTDVRNRLNGDASGSEGGTRLSAKLGGSFSYGPPRHCHTFSNYLPFPEYGKTHPEWFSLIDGKRRGGEDEKIGKGQLCLVNPEVAVQCAAQLERFVALGDRRAEERGEPLPAIYDISQNDFRRFCECEGCRAEIEAKGYSGYVCDFVKKVTAEMSKKRPELLYSTFAYHNTEPVPSKGVSVADNLVIKLCNTSQNMAAGIFDESNRTMHDLVLAWRARARHLFVWEYAITYGSFGAGYPFASEFHIAEKYRFYADNNVSGYLIEHENPACSDLYAIKFQLECKMLEDPFRKDADHLADDLIREYYGKGGGKVLAARRCLDELRQRRKGNVFWFPHVTDFDFLRLEDIAKMRGIYDDAETAVRGDSKYERRVAEARKSVDRIYEFLTAGGGRHPPEKGVSDTSFYELPVGEKFCKVWGADFIPDTEVGDSLAGGMTVARMKVTDANRKHLSLPSIVGVYDATKKKTIASLNIKKPVTEEYRWYTLKGVTLPNGGSYVYFTRSWGIQLYVTNANMKGKTFDIKALVKLQGSEYFAGSVLPSEVRVARVVFCDPE